jgi:hypothetical protein
MLSVSVACLRSPLLISFQKALARELAAGFGNERDIRKTVAAAKSNYSERHLRLPESAFLNKFVVPRS